MKRLLTALLVLLSAAGIFAQAPQKMSYQAVVRDNQDHLVTNHAIGIQITILQGLPTGTVVYTENQAPTTNANGLISIEIGGGAGFSSIDWSAGPYFLKSETDPAGGTNYTISGTTQLLSVPYAIYSKTAQTADYNDLSNLPTLFNGTWTDLTGKPTTLAGFGIIDAMNISHDAYGITSTDITNWNTAYGWGNHALEGYAPGIRTLTINGTAYDLTTNRSWNVGTVTSIGMSLPGIFSVSGSPVTGSGTLSAALVSQSANHVFASPSGSAGTPLFRTLDATDIPNLDWSKITSGKPATLTGYGITDGVNTTGNQTIAGNKTFTGTTIVPTPVNATDAATKAYVDDNAPTTYSVGDFAQGGIVFWVDETRQHGLICAKQDQSTGVKWCPGTFGNSQSKGDGPFAGETNTSIIIAAHVAIGDDGSTYAARICNELKITENGKTYGDWYLPSKEELNLMYQNKSAIDATALANSGSEFANGIYWSSTEYDLSSVWSQDLNDGMQHSVAFLKDDNSLRVRAIRAF